MQLLDRYLTAIKFWLPKTHRDDIAAELAANLQAEIDDRAAELGRPLTESEIAAILKQHGSPVVVASRYQQEKRTVNFGRQFIGPIVFPFYWIAVKVTLVLLLVSSIIPIFLFTTHGPPFAGLGNALVRLMRFSLPVLLLVTVLFALIDFCLRKTHFIEKWTGDWDPASLPTSDRQAGQVRRSSSIAGIILQSIFIVWWWNHGSIPYLAVTNAGAQVHFAPILTTLHIPILIIGFINLAQHWLNLVHPGWRWLPPATGLISSFAALILLYPLLYTSPLLSIFDRNGIPISAREAATIQHTISLAATATWFGILAAGLIYAGQLIRLAWKTMPPPVIQPRSNGVAHS
jgi:hypothetical protein